MMDAEQKEEAIKRAEASRDEWLAKSADRFREAERLSRSTDRILFLIFVLLIAAFIEWVVVFGFMGVAK